MAREQAKRIAEGTMIGGDYQIIPASPERLELGEGGMGAVYLAEETSLGRKVVIKVIRTRDLTDTVERKFYEMHFAAEAAAAGRCNHPALVTLYRAGHDEELDLSWYAMEYIPTAVDLGAKLEQCVDGDGVSTMPFDLIATYLKEAAAGLREIHSHQIVHRDIKLENFLVFDTPDGPRLKILDFGIARLPEGKLTKTGVFFGSPGVVSPDLARARTKMQPYEPQATDDLYGLGGAAYRLLTGHKPIRSGNDMMETVRRQMYAVPSSPKELRPETPTGLDHVCRRLLEPFAEDRYPSAQAVLDDLRKLDTLGEYVPKPAREPDTGGKDVPTTPFKVEMSNKTQPGGEKPGFDVAGFAVERSDTGEVGLSGPGLRAAVQPAANPIAEESKTPFWSLRRRVRLAVFGIGGVALLVAVGFGVFLLRQKTPADATAQAPIVDPGILAQERQIASPEDILELEHKKREEKVLEDQRGERAAQAAAHAPVTPAASEATARGMPGAKVYSGSKGARTARVEESGRAVSAEPPGPEPRRKNIDQIISAGPETDATSKPTTPGKQTFGVSVDTKLQARLGSAISSEAPETLVVATLTKTYQGMPGTTPLPSGTKLFGQAQFNFMSNRIDLVFSKLQLPGATGVVVISARAIEPNGQAGLPARIAKRDQRSKANVGEAALDVVDKVVGDSTAADRFTNDKRDDARELRSANTTLTLPVNTKLTIQFREGV